MNNYGYRSLCIMTSLSKDGDLQSKILSKMGYQIVRGSSSRGGAKGLVGMIRKIKQGYDAAFAVDGPRGPIYQAKPGVIFLAEKTNAVIVPVAVSAKKSWVLNNWDKYMLPKPFTKTVIKYGQPIEVPKGSDHNKILETLNVRLNELTKNLDKDLKKN
ncbi:lysophospholipid acyltransferase family protein [bacterium]